MGNPMDRRRGLVFLTLLIFALASINSPDPEEWEDEEDDWDDDEEEEEEWEDEEDDWDEE